eukprot:TRINITY_DN66469_c8_g1_i1.p1 TRINITY_DN66469_c8_g1~~TRINITY_DN66469_c8_g1_i1.p1  ORF type:complete len:289 (+),score=149.74 TRINITY_DN66469_c8_g1_i1:87-953(+)
MAGSRNSKSNSQKAEEKDIEMVVDVGAESDNDSDNDGPKPDPPNPVSRILGLSLLILILSAVALDQPWYHGSSTKQTVSGAAAAATQTTYELRVSSVELEDSTPTRRNLDYDQLVLLNSKSVMAVVQALQVLIVVCSSILFVLAAWQFTDMSPTKQRKVSNGTKWIYFVVSKKAALFIVLFAFASAFVPLALMKTLDQDDVLAQATSQLNTAAGKPPTQTCGTMTGIVSLDCGKWWGVETNTQGTSEYRYRTFPTVSWFLNWVAFGASLMLFNSVKQATRGDFNLYGK